MSADGEEEAFDLILEKDDKRYSSHAYDSVEKRAEQAHFHDLRHKQPKDDKDKYAKEDI